MLMDVEFRQLFSEKRGLDAEQFERKLFYKCLFRHALPFAWLLQKCDKDFFHEDFGMLRDVASARNTDEVICEVNRFYGRNARDKSFLRTVLFLRVSGKRVLQTYRALLKEGTNVSDEAATSAESLPVF
jgi:hypothetical protein